MKGDKGDRSFPDAVESIKSLGDVTKDESLPDPNESIKSIKSLGDVTKELQNTIDDNGEFFPDVDVVIRSLKVVDEYLTQDEPNIHEIYYGNGELIEVMFLNVGSRAKSYLHTSLKWMDVYEYLSSIDAKLKKIFKDTEYETGYAEYSSTFACEGGINFRQGSGGRVMPLVIPPPLENQKLREFITANNERIREFIMANMLLSEFFWLCDFILDSPAGKELLDAFVIYMTNRVKSRLILVGPDHVKKMLKKWEKCKQKQEEENTK